MTSIERLQAEVTALRLQREILLKALKEIAKVSNPWNALSIARKAIAKVELYDKDTTK